MGIERKRSLSEETEESNGKAKAESNRKMNTANARRLFLEACEL